MPIIGGREEEARAKYEKVKSHADILGGLVQVIYLLLFRKLWLIEVFSSRAAKKAKKPEWEKFGVEINILECIQALGISDHLTLAAAPPGKLLALSNTPFTPLILALTLPISSS